MTHTTRTFKLDEFTNSTVEKEVDGYDYCRLVDGSLVVMGRYDYYRLNREKEVTLQLDDQGFDGVPKYI